MSPRSIWSGAVSFGLVSVPVRMVSATQSKELKFHFVHKDDLAPVGYDKVRKDTGEHVDADDIVRASVELTQRSKKKPARKQAPAPKAS